ncbi:cupin domain-containing protein [Deinococcus apachensis]|uniref:cupin domain-containing protein n=1 Tax=Deinococcus apachensis TaxID=309886 RepID=UPI00037FCF70|nr:cupin domain-containing protein [Deinococcus apachensis]
MTQTATLPAPTLSTAPFTIYNPVQKDSVTFLRRTDGRCSTLVDVELAPGGGNGLHTHTAYSEEFTCREGLLGIHLDGREITLRPGESALAPIGSVHRFYNASPEPVRFRTEIAPGHRGFEQGLILSYGLAQGGQVNAKGIPMNIWHLALIADMTDSRLAGPLRVLNPVLTSLARRARARGIEAELLRRYVNTTA